MIHRTLLSATCVAAIGSASPVFADSAALFAALGLPEIIAIMRREGLSSGTEIAAELFPDQINANWPQTVAEIYDLERMQTGIETDFIAAFDGQTVENSLAFFESDLGRTIVGLEGSGRRAMLDDAVGAMAKDAAVVARADNTVPFQLVDKFV